MDPKTSPLAQLQQVLKARLQKAGDVAVLAVGSELRGDDGVALRVAELLEANASKPSNLQVFVGTTAPENCTGPIRQLMPSHLLVIDAADVGKEPGTVELLDASHLAGVSFCTHALPLSVVIDYIVSACPGCEVLVLGIQPKQLEFGRALTPSVEAAAQGLSDVLCRSLGGV
jgi:hydrogenase 3 maturation protease